MKYTKKIFVIMFSFFIIAVLVSFSYAHFVKDNITGNELSSIMIKTKTENDFVNKLTVNYENGQNPIKVDDIPNADYQNIFKFTVKAESLESINARMRWDNVLSNINTLNSEYNLYRCSEANYNIATYENVGTNCTNVGRTTYKTLPTTREERLVTSALYETIPANTTNYYVLKINITNNAGKYFYANIDIDFSQEYYTFAEAIYNAYTPVSDASIYFTSISSASNGEGLYSNDKNSQGGTIKYFRGAVNNYVTFAGITWRVVRINPSGNVRLITQDTILPKTAFNPTYNDPNYVGYTYDRTADSLGASSTIKTALDSWYTSNLSTYSSYINQTAEYCNDASGSTSAYGAYLRNINAKTPTFSCPTPISTYGGTYQLPIGTITADEVAYAGGLWNTNNTSYYLNNGTAFWTMSPYDYYVGSGAVDEFVVGSAGNLHSSWVANTTRGFRAVIELNSDTLVTGQGTSTSPWVVQ